MKRSYRIILFAGTFVGTLDIAAAMFRYYFSTGKDPMNVARFIASGVFGKEAFAGGMTMGIYGLIFHFGIAFWWTGLYFFFYPRLKLSSVNKYLAGIVYGVVVWCGMNLVVLPLSHVPQRPFELLSAMEGVVILMACVGLPISILRHKQ